MIRILPILSLVLVGCKGGGEEDPVLEDAQNYDFTSTISAVSTTITSGADTTVDWSGLTTDILGNTMDPTTDVNEIRIVNFPDLTQAEVLEGINSGTISQSDIDVFFAFSPAGGETSAPLSEFDVLGTLLVPGSDITADKGTFLVSAVTVGEGPDGGPVEEYRMFEFFAPTDGAPAATIALAGDSATLDYTVDIESGAALSISEGRVDVDWSRLTLDGAGQPIDLPDIDVIMLARYDETPAEIEANFLQIETMAEETYLHDVSGSNAWPLQDLETADGTKFETFDGEGTWILALLCSTCINPAPLFLAPVQTP